MGILGSKNLVTCKEYLWEAIVELLTVIVVRPFGRSWGEIPFRSLIDAASARRD